jgi:hypothetical protein
MKKDLFPIPKKDIKPLSELHHKDEFTDIIVPSWLPLPIKTKLEEYLHLTKESGNSPSRVLYEHFRLNVRSTKLVLPAFLDPSTKESWHKLVALSEEASLEFIYELLRMENDFEGIIELFHKTQSEITQGKKIVGTMETLLEDIEEYHGFYSHFIEEAWKPTLKDLSKLKVNLLKSIDKFEQDHNAITKYSCDFAPFSRQFKSDSAKSIFFVRKMNLFFIEQYQKPMHEEVAIFVNAIFKTTYVGNEIIKMVIPNKKYLKTPH